MTTVPGSSKVEAWRRYLEERLAYLNKQISEYPYWGAALTAYNEERNGVIHALALLPKEPQP